jgi:hypothetical protein
MDIGGSQGSTAWKILSGLQLASKVKIFDDCRIVTSGFREIFLSIVIGRPMKWHMS